MKTRLLFIFISVFNLLFIQIADSTEFDELDKPPEGAHEGQMFLGAFFSLGRPYGSLIDAEKDFVSGSTKEFDNGVYKKLQISHQSYAIGVSFEYMPVNHLGAAISFRRTYLIQNTNFGSDYENWKGYLYRDYTLFLSPAIHATNRKGWDFVFIPLIGYSYGKYNATPVAGKTIDNYSGDTKRKTHGFSFGADLNCTIYFTGGLYISLGGEWVRNMLNMGKKFDLTNPQTGKKYSAKTSDTIDTFGIIIGAGYAFSK